MHLIHLGRAPQYLVDCVQLVNTSSIRHLRSSDATDYLNALQELSLASVASATLRVWTSGMKLLPPHLRRPTITDTNYFKRHLKSFLFTESLLGFLDKLYSGAMQITDCIVLYCIVLYAGS